MEKSILLVDDDHILRVVVAQMLTKKGYHVFEAADGANGLKIFEAQQSKINLVISDFEMPILNGGQMMMFILSVRRTIPGIIISGRKNIDFESYGLNEENIYFVEKPFNVEHLANLVSDCLSPDAPVLNNHLRVKQFM